MSKDKKHIALIGFMGSGKTIVGLKLAQKLNLNHVDTDKVIEIREGRSISQLFAEEGEDYFRKLESDLLANSIATSEQLVISTGGGVVLAEENREQLTHAVVFYLKTSPELIYERVQVDSSRPLLADTDDLYERIESILSEREEIYTAVADYVIATDNKKISEIIDEIRGYL